MAKKTRTELSTSAINTNLPDNTQELITPTTERAQLADERESVINYKDDLGGTGNAGKFLTVAVDGESLTMVDAPTGDVTGTGVAGQVTFWNGTNNITSDAMLVIDDTNKILKIIIPNANASGGISIDQQGTTGTGSLQFLDDGVYKAQIVYDVSDGNLTLNSNGDIKITPTGDTVISGGTPIVEHVRISSGGNVGIGTSFPDRELDVEKSTDNCIISAVSGTTRVAGLVMGDTSDDDRGAVLYNNNGDYLYLLSNGSQKLTIGSNWTSNLDAYEEGDYVPSLVATTTINFTARNSSYTRIGNVCTVVGIMDMDTITGSNQVTIDLPFTCATETDGSGFAQVIFLPAIGVNPSGGAGNIVGTVFEGTNTFKIWTAASSTGANLTNVVYNDLTSSRTFFRYTVTYRTI